jgi:non-ribosomal peptide synthetase component E (peptide arylation enzyme)
MGRKVAWKEKVVTLAQVLTESCEKYGQKAAVVFEGKKYAFKEVDEEVRRGSTWLHQIGALKVARVHIIGTPRSIETSMRKV